MRNIKELVELYLDNDNLEIIKKIGYISEKNNFTYEIKNSYYLACYPKKIWFTNNTFVIEDYFNLKIFTDFLLKDVTCFKDIPKKDNRKTDFANECKNFDKSEFEWFKVLFDLILTIN